MIIQNKRIFASILFVLISFVSIAQGGGPPPPGPPPPVGLPIDGFVSIMVAIGVFFGSKSLLRKNQN